MTTCEQLLQEYNASGDPTCFRSLVDELGGMVYAVCLRITGDPHTAEDLSQDCFLELARKASTVRTSVAGWLHSTATNRALNLIRARKQERPLVTIETSTDLTRETEDFSELQTLVDDAVNQLDEPLRQIVIGHYLEGRSQTEIAQRLGVDQSTVSRRLSQGLNEIRSQLRRIGILTSVAALMNVLGQSSANAAPPTLTATAAKIGLAGVGWSATPPSSWNLGLLLSTFAATAGNILFSLFCEGWLFALLIVVEIAAFLFPPKWFKTVITELLQGVDPWAHPAFPFKRWTWTVPPRDWKSRFAGWLLMGVVLNLVALGGFLNAPNQSVQAICMATMGTVFGLVPAVRLGIRVWWFRSEQTLASTQTPPSQVHGTWEMVATGAAYVILSVSFLIAGAIIHHLDEKIWWIRPLIMWGNLVGSIAFFTYAVISRWYSQPNADLKSNQPPVTPHTAHRPINPRIQFAFMMLFAGTAIVILGKAVLSATVSRFLLREPYVRVVPITIVIEGALGLFSSIGFLSFLIRMRDQLVHWNYLLLLVVGIGLSAGGLTAISYGDYLALTTLPSPVQVTAERPMSDQERDAHVKVEALRRKYAREMSAVLPHVIPATFTHRDDVSQIFPIIQEAPAARTTGQSDLDWEAVLRRWLEQFERPVPLRADRVKAFFVHRYFKVVSRAEKPVFNHTFVCASPADAEAIAAAWGHDAIQKDYLVTVVFEKPSREPLTSNDPLLLAIRRQLESADLPSSPPESQSDAH